MGGGTEKRQEISSVRFFFFKPIKTKKVLRVLTKYMVRKRRDINT